MDHKIVKEDLGQSEMYKAVLMIVDEATNSCMAYPAKHKDATEVQKALQHFIGSIKPKLIRSDNAK